MFASSITSFVYLQYYFNSMKYWLLLNCVQISEHIVGYERHSKISNDLKFIDKCYEYYYSSLPLKSISCIGEIPSLVLTLKEASSMFSIELLLKSNFFNDLSALKAFAGRESRWLPLKSSSSASWMLENESELGKTVMFLWRHDTFTPLQLQIPSMHFRQAISWSKNSTYKNIKTWSNFTIDILLPAQEHQSVLIFAAKHNMFWSFVLYIDPPVLRRCCSELYLFDPDFSTVLQRFNFRCLGCCLESGL